MGAGIAFVAAAAGYPVTVVDPSASTRERAAAAIARERDRAKPESLAAITFLEDMPALSDAWLAVEAVPEDLELKRDVFLALASALGDDAILTTNTSALSVGEIASRVPQPSRVAGLHFFNPPARMQLVEVVVAAETSEPVAEALRSFVRSLGKTPVSVADTPGFLVNRVARPYYLQAMHSLDRGVASMEDLDALARGIGFRMGPFELMDLIGLDVNLATSQSIFERTGAARLEPVQRQRELVAAGDLGRKTGRGFYDYAGGPPERDAAAPSASARNDDEIVAVVGFGNTAVELGDALHAAYSNVVTIENDDAVDEIPEGITLAVDTGDGAADRSDIIRRMDARLAPECVIFVDAYATDLVALVRRLNHPERIVGYGILGSPTRQRCVEIVDLETTGDDALALAQELFESIGKKAVLVENAPGLFLGRTVGSIVNEAIYAVDENVATPEDVDLAMRLGTNYPLGPIEWGREIGGARLSRILKRLAEAEDPAFAPHRAMWILDAGEEPDES